MKTFKKFVLLILASVFFSSFIVGAIKALVEKDIQALTYIFFRAGFALIIPVSIGVIAYHLTIHYLSKKIPNFSKLKYKLLVGLCLAITFGATAILVQAFPFDNTQTIKEMIKRFRVVAVYFGVIIPLLHHNIFKPSGLA